MIDGFEIRHLVTCTLNTQGLPPVTYNVSQMEADAIEGRFGPPQEGRYDELETLGPEEEWRNLEQSKVLFMIRAFQRGMKVPNPFQRGKLCHIIDIPFIAVMLRLGPHVMAVTPVDGNHRGKARMLLGAKTFQRFIVPEEIEDEYRLQTVEI